MKYKHILSQSHILLKEFYIDNHLIANIKNSTGIININGIEIGIKKDSTFIIPKFSHISCSVTQQNHAQIELELLLISEKTLTDAFTNLSAITHIGAQAKTNTPNYFVETPETITNNFALFQQALPILGDLQLEQCFLKQSLVFILMALDEANVDVFNVFRFNYDEPKERMIAQLITLDPKRKWSVDDMAKALFTTQSTLRRHLAKEGVSFSQLLLDIRMGIALNYLTFANYSISQISHCSGFGSAAYFCDAFKRKYGITPSQFRTNSRENNDMHALNRLTPTQ
ncbi:helix-turn-helix transcriptional regulator [Photobacterium profundum]|uniref:helix-turn-helix transcriptional regulator n=1 Tax=Photobacterium profundum TaxID=74109 RepID=UPI003D141B6E